MAAQRPSERKTKTKANRAKETGITKKAGGVLDYFRFGESYTSLILGIVIVIIASILLISFVKNKNIGKLNPPQQQISENAASTSAFLSPTHAVQPTHTIVPTKTIVLKPTLLPTATPTVKPTQQPTGTPRPTVQPTIVAKAVISPTPKPTLTLVPTRKATPTITLQAKLKPTVSPVPTQIAQVPTTQPNTHLPTTYTVQLGDNLWTIAEKYYNSGYNWVDIARANNLSNANSIDRGQKLNIPNVAVKIATVTTTQHMAVANAINGSTYTVVKGDDLWNIAVRAYGDGYRWVDIARTNKLANPSVIHSGNVLTIPRA